MPVHHLNLSVTTATDHTISIKLPMLTATDSAMSVRLAEFTAEFNVNQE